MYDMIPPPPPPNSQLFSVPRNNLSIVSLGVGSRAAWSDLDERGEAAGRGSATSPQLRIRTNERCRTLSLFIHQVFLVASDWLKLVIVSSIYILLTTNRS